MSSPRFERIGEVDDCLIEEMAELTKIICKAKRFGMLSYHPNDKEKRPNALLILDEIEDVERRLCQMKHIVFNELRMMDHQVCQVKV